jgi:hypothetical protein
VALPSRRPMVLERMVLGRMVLGRMALERMAPGPMVLGRVAPGRVAPGPMVLGRVAPGRAALVSAASIAGSLATMPPDGHYSRSTAPALGAALDRALISVAN